MHNDVFPGSSERLEKRLFVIASTQNVIIVVEYRFDTFAGRHCGRCSLVNSLIRVWKPVGHQGPRSKLRREEAPRPLRAIRRSRRPQRTRRRILR
jgi:hypothetical protein